MWTQFQPALIFSKLRNSERFRVTPHHIVAIFGLAICGLLNCAQTAVGQSNDSTATVEDSAVEAAGEESNAEEGTDEDPQAVPEEQTIPIPAHWKRLGKPGQSEIWLDQENKSVIVAGHTCLTRGGLEMFVCPVNTKEHESVIAAHSQAFEVHAALLAVKAKPGNPVEWDPKYKPASGSIIEVKVTWRDPESGRLVTRWGKELVRNYRDGTGLANDWVFGGSILEKDPDTGESYYYAEGGPLLCVSNFATAAIDLNVPSTASDEGLLYEAFTENLPAKGTKVYLQLTPGEYFRGE